MTWPLVSVGTIAKTVDVTPQAAVRLVGELGTAEMTGEVSSVGDFVIGYRC